ncbi:hypothetical protein CPB84DRAFT_1704679 [Gymnopilus junonius]|uniref:Uncharacterized protein n=1 Tax=Gymnopilus junonius TaxID=109634 RepID=A0A9P5NTV2_GYMJU|nr:hypothetical protein CPB84DRAFT_1704679 [Gymnopilus junonius]
MPFSYSRLFLEGSTFCCCLPVRLGVVSMSILGCLVAGLLTVVLWFEVSSAAGLTSGERDAFIVAALTETILFAASIFGLVGAIVRKQSLVRIYSYILYIHFTINLGVAAYLAYEVIHATTSFENLACETAIKDPQAQGQCEGFLGFARWVYLVIAITVLIVELYGAIIVTRYLNQLKRGKATTWATRLDTEHAFQLKVQNGHQYTRLEEPGGDSEGRLPGYLPPLGARDLEPSDFEFNPYTESEFDRQIGLLTNSNGPPLSTGVTLVEHSQTTGEMIVQEALVNDSEATMYPDHLVHVSRYSESVNH